MSKQTMTTRLLPSLMLLLAPIMSMLIGAAGASPSWCVCRQGASDAELQSALDFACGNGADCGPLRPGGNCDDPTTLLAHCSYAVNNYFFQSDMGATCHLNGTALPSSTDPSSGTCKYPASEVTKTTSIRFMPFVFFIICLAAGGLCLLGLKLGYDHCWRRGAPSRPSTSGAPCKKEDFRLRTSSFYTNQRKSHKVEESSWSNVGVNSAAGTYLLQF